MKKKIVLKPGDTLEVKVASQTKLKSITRTTTPWKPPSKNITISASGGKKKSAVAKKKSVSKKKQE